MAESPYIPAESVPHERRPLVGYAMVLVAATLFAVNGAVSKVVLHSGISSLQLTEVRSTGACLGLFLLVAAVAPHTLRVRRQELAILAFFGVCGVAFVQLFYFLTIDRLEIGVALLIQYTAPILVALWARFVYREHVRRRVWAALILSLGGLSLVVDIYGGLSLDGLGVVFGIVSSVIYALYLLTAEREVGRRDPLSLLAFGFLFATIFWAIVVPWWNFPARRVAEEVSLRGNLADAQLPIWALMLWVVVLGTMIPFGLIVASLRHVPATRVAVVAMLEPVLGTVVAFAWLDETLGAQQLAGGAVVLAGIFLAQTAR